MATMRKIKGRYYIRIFSKGRVKSFATGTGDKTKAKKKLKEIKEREYEFKAGMNDRILIDGPKDLAECIEIYLKSCSKRLALKTVKCYSVALEHLQSAFRAYNIDEIRSTDQERLFKEFEKRNYNPTTININLRGVRAFFNWLVENELAGRQPFKIKMVRLENQNPKFLRPAELEAIYKLIDDDDLKSTFRVYERTGMRLSELRNSKREGNYINITKTKSKIERLVRLDMDVINDYDIAKRRNFSPDYLSHQFTKYKRLAGIEGKKTFHSFRHTFAVRKLLETRNIYTVRDLLGHSSVIVTEIYTKMPIDFLKEVFQTDTELNLNGSRRTPLDKLDLSSIIPN